MAEGESSLDRFRDDYLRLDEYGGRECAGSGYRKKLYGFANGSYIDADGTVVAVNRTGTGKSTSTESRLRRLPDADRYTHGERTMLGDVLEEGLIGDFSESYGNAEVLPGSGETFENARKDFKSMLKALLDMEGNPGKDYFEVKGEEPRHAGSHSKKEKETMEDGNEESTRVMGYKDLKEKIDEASKSHQNLVFHGAPGTGKTYSALKAIAELICEKGGDEYKDCPFTGEKPHEWLKKHAGDRFEMVQFHPSYDYTDFVEGLRPYSGKDGSIGFRLEPGVFMEFCGKARADKDRQHYMLIDEINRGDVSKIFGELFFLLDSGYRGAGIKTQYSNLHDADESRDKFRDCLEDGLFSIPDNVTIIGTMNDIDRSVDSLDFAMRRRFRFIEVDAESSWKLLFGDAGQDGSGSVGKAYRLMKSINGLIESEPDGLGPDYALGATYFLELANAAVDDFDQMKERLWSDRIEPLLCEYARGTDLDVEKLKTAWNETEDDSDDTQEDEPEGE